MSECREIDGFPGYFVHDDGRVYSEKTKRFLSLCRHSGGYRVVYLCRHSRYSVRYVHRLVLEAFVGQVEPGIVANHKNFDRTDNRLENLEWVTQARNLAHSHDAGRMPPAWKARKHRAAIIERLDRGMRTAEIVAELRVSRDVVWAVARRHFAKGVMKKRSVELRPKQPHDDQGRFTKRTQL